MMKLITRNLRFSEDIVSNSSVSPESLNSSSLSKKIMTLNGMPITDELLPDLYKIIYSCCEIIGVNNNDIQSYVYPSSEINAQCQQIRPSEYILAISSGIINLLNNKELEFVIGHEIGHAVLNHFQFDFSNPEYIDHDIYKLSRAGEISADRIGYVCSSDSDSVFSALMKICSGLNDNYLNFDINSFVSLAKNLKDPINLSQLEMTHPPLVIRARALIWFSMSELINTFNTDIENNKEYKKELDLRVNNDLKTYVDNKISINYQTFIEDFKFWFFTFVFVSDGTFSEDEQIVLKSQFSEELVSKLKIYLSDLSTDAVVNDIWLKLLKSYTNLKSISQSSVSDQLKNSVNILSKYVKKNSLDALVKRLEANDNR